MITFEVVSLESQLLYTGSDSHKKSNHVDILDATFYNFFSSKLRTIDR